jgi:hypothetical protein
MEATELRDTNYATELATSAIGDNRIERILVKELEAEEIRMSWWPKGKMVPRPLDVPEKAFIQLIAHGIRDGVLGPFFIFDLTEALKKAREEKDDAR